ncbi:hypothetical protein GCM10009817_14770 [Terrabacter lapilli]|uniref:Uncharacterized protein n=1 Tax=Terrabacter lapilli TaxID=436231 RepID=A0ABN2RW31_9MICO
MVGAGRSGVRGSAVIVGTGSVAASPVDVAVAVLVADGDCPPATAGDGAAEVRPSVSGPHADSVRPRTTALAAEKTIRCRAVWPRTPVAPCIRPSP